MTEWRVADPTNMFTTFSKKRFDKIIGLGTNHCRRKFGSLILATKRFSARFFKVVLKTIQGTRRIPQRLRLYCTSSSRVMGGRMSGEFLGFS